MRNDRRSFIGGGLGLLAGIGSGQALASADDVEAKAGFRYSVLHLFNRHLDGGRGVQRPGAPLLLASDGAYYGTSPFGGRHGRGTVFRMSPDGTVAIVHHFKNWTGGDGDEPVAALIQARNGKLYGTTMMGGVDSIGGTVFCVSLDGHYQLLHTFTGGDGTWPYGPLFEASDGLLYGTTIYGGGVGGSGNGCVYRISLDGELEVVYTFSPFSGGIYPHGGVIEAPDGWLYGSTFEGGNAGSNGTLWRLDKSGAFEQLHRFGRVDGMEPQGSLILTRDGEFFGVASLGGAFGAGVLFRLGRHGLVSAFKSLNPRVEGAQPFCSPLEGSDGHLYLTTSHGSPTEGGAVVQVRRDGKSRVVRSFRKVGAYSPQASLIEDPAGRLLGTTYLSNYPTGSGAVFALTHI